MTEEKPYRPLIIAHRGLNREAPENTISAFEKAIGIGADGVELDILPCQEGTLVVTHDESIERFTQIRKNVSSLSLSQLKKLDFGAYFSSHFRGERIPTLEEVFELLKGKAWINIEIKGTNIFSDGREKTLVDLIRKWKIEDQVVVSSFNIFSLHRMKKRAPEIKRGYLYYEGQFKFSQGRFKNWIKPYSLHPSIALFSASEFCLSLDNYWVWTVNKMSEFERCYAQKVEAIITDCPKNFILI
ncbi:MAG: glycerophosphodiester phosphodiesterase [Deltaproteobacteria bacterium]|nr:glycerophosphodiester phosphodiesterase [Deltaproteobacteria bacterium]